MSLHHSMHDWYIRPRNLVYRDIADAVPLFGRISEEKQVSAIERGLHGSTEKVRRRFAQLGTGVVGKVDTKVPQDDDDRGFGVGQKSETFPDHETRSHDRCKVQHL